MVRNEAYWLDVCDGRLAAAAYIQASGEAVIDAIERYPILMLPEFPAAIALLGASTNDPQAETAHGENARALRTAQQTLREGIPTAYAGLLSRLAIMLAQEPAGDRRTNLEHAAEAFHAAGSVLETGPDYASMLVDEGTARWQLAEFGVDPQANIARAAALYSAARTAFDHGPNAGQAATNEGQALTSLAEHGVDSASNFDKAAQLFLAAFGEFDEGDPRRTACVVGAAHAMARLDEIREAESRGS